MNTFENFEKQARPAVTDRKKLQQLVHDFEWMTVSVQEVLDGLMLSVAHEAKEGKAFDNKVSIDDQIVLVIESLLKTAFRYNNGFTDYNGYLHVYNGTYWASLEVRVLKPWLGEIAAATGMPHIQAIKTRNTIKLYEQLVERSPLPPESTTDITRINLANGTLTIDAGGARITPHNMSNFMTYALDFCYDPEAGCPEFDSYLNDVLPEKALQHILAEYIGYVFVPNSVLNTEKIMILLGSGANGKSVFFRIINALLGQQNISQYSIASLTDVEGKTRSAIGTKLLNYSTELDEFKNKAVFKQLISGEPVEARVLYRDSYIMYNYARLIVNANQLPRTLDHTQAYFRRLLIIPFDVSIPEMEQDNELAGRIIDNELPGVLNWVIRGLNRLLKYRTFTHSDSSVERLSDYRENSNTASLFMSESGYQADPNARKRGPALFTEYLSYCETCNYKPMGRNSFFIQLRRDQWPVEESKHNEVIFHISNK